MPSQIPQFDFDIDAILVGIDGVSTLHDRACAMFKENYGVVPSADSLLTVRVTDFEHSGEATGSLRGDRQQMLKQALDAFVADGGSPIDEVVAILMEVSDTGKQVSVSVEDADLEPYSHRTAG